MKRVPFISFCTKEIQNNSNMFSVKKIFFVLMCLLNILITKVVSSQCSSSVSSSYAIYTMIDTFSGETGGASYIIL